MCCPRGPFSYPHLFFSFLFLLFWLGGLYCFVFQIADPFFCNLQSAIDFLLVYFFIAVIVFFRSHGLCLIFSVSLLKFSLSSSILLPSSVRIFMSLTLNSVPGKLLIFTLFNSFPEVLSYSFFWQLFFVFSLFLTLFVCFCVLGISATPPSLERVALCRRCPVGPVTQSPNVIKSRSSGVLLCGLGMPSYCGWVTCSGHMRLDPMQAGCKTQPWLLWVCTCAWLVPRMTDWVVWPWLVEVCWCSEFPGVGAAFEELAVVGRMRRGGPQENSRAGALSFS